LSLQRNDGSLLEKGRRESDKFLEKGRRKKIHRVWRENKIFIQREIVWREY
jgi:hypothetical protein